MKVQAVNHIALLVKDAVKSAEFYSKYCGMEVVHSRKDGDINVRWVRIPGQDDGFMIVLLETMGDLSDEPERMDHIGIYVESRKDVDEIAAMAQREGILRQEAEWGGNIIGYYCMIQDPDGNTIEFSAEHATI